MEEIFNSFQKSVLRLEEVLNAEKTLISRDAAIQRFEFTVELAWKSMQKVLRNKEIICRSPKDCLQEAFKVGLIKDNELWLKVFQDRNLTVHTYNEKTADEIYSRLPQYLSLFQELKEKLGAAKKNE